MEKIAAKSDVCATACPAVGRAPKRFFAFALLILMRSAPPGISGGWEAGLRAAHGWCSSLAAAVV